MKRIYASDGQLVNWYLNYHHIHKRGLDGGLNASAPFNAMNLSWHLTDILRGASEGEAMVGDWRLAWIGRNCISLWILFTNFCMSISPIVEVYLSGDRGWLGDGLGEEGREAVPRSRQLSHYAATNPATKLLPTSCLSTTSLPTLPCLPPRSTCLSPPSSTTFLSSGAVWVDSHIMRQRILQRSYSDLHARDLGVD